MIRGLLKRSSGYFGGLAFTRVFTTVVFILLARQFSPNIFGQFVLYATLITVVTFVADFGLIQWYQRNAENKKRDQLFGKVLSVRTYTTIISVLLLGFFLYMTKTFSPYVSLIFLANIIPDAMLSIMVAYYIEIKQPIKAAFNTFGKAVVLLTAIFVFGDTLSANGAYTAYFLGSLATAIILFPWKTTKYMSQLSANKLFGILKESSAYAILIITSLVYKSGDQFIIRYSLTSAALGYYGTAYRYLEGLSLLPGAIAQNLFPISAKKDGLTLQQLHKLTGVMVVVGLMFSILLYVLSDFLIVFVVGEAYAAAVGPLRVFSAVLFLFFVNAPLATVVQSSKFVKQFLPWGIMNTAFNIALNILFVSQYGIIAASFVMLFTEIIGLIINLHFVRKVYEV